MKTRTIVFSVLGVIVLMVFCFAFTIHILLLNIRNEYRKLNLGDKREEKGIEYLNLVSDMLNKDFNVIIDKNLYEVEYVYIQGGYFFTTPDSFIMQKKNMIYKSKYFYTNNEENEKYEKVLVVENMKDEYLLNKEKENYYKDERTSLFLAILDRLGFREYVLNNLLYDESKGNNFSEIEKIFDKYKKGKIYREVGWYNQNNQYAGELKMFYGKEKDMKYDNAFSGFLVYKKANEKEGYFNSYIEHFIKYFDKKVQFEKINWYEFKKYNQLRPVIIFNFENSEKKDLEKIRDKIKKYYNQEEVTIVLTGYNREVNDPYGIW